MAHIDMQEGNVQQVIVALQHGTRFRLWNHDNACPECGSTLVDLHEPGVCVAWDGRQQIHAGEHHPVGNSRLQFFWLRSGAMPDVQLVVPRPDKIVCAGHNHPCGVAYAPFV